MRKHIYVRTMTMTCTNKGWFNSRTCSISSIQIHSEALWARLRRPSPVKNSVSLRRLSAMLVLPLVWRYLICGFGGGVFGVGAEWAPGQGKGVDSALRLPRSCSSSCLPDWRAADQLESSSLNTKPDSGKLPGAYYTEGFNSTGKCSWCLDYILGRKVKKG